MLISILPKLFQKIGEEGKLSSTFCKASLPWYQNQIKTTHKKENHRSISLMKMDAKIINNASIVWNPQYIKIIYPYINISIHKKWSESPKEGGASHKESENLHGDLKIVSTRSHKHWAKFPKEKLQKWRESQRHGIWKEQEVTEEEWKHNN